MSQVKSPISIYALGGLCEVGKNTYCIENDETLIIIDAGVLFPDPSLLGVNYVIPDYTRLQNSRQKVKALFITHGHEDHIGGIPFLVQSLNIPVIYAPRLAAALIKHKLSDFRVKTPVNIVEYDRDTVVNVDDFTISFFQVTHSIPDSFGICVDTPHGRIVHTGDFKIDLTPVGQQFDLTRIARIGSEGVDLLLSDSTNAEIEGYTPSETNVYKSIDEIFDNTKGRLILSTFSSNINRIQQVAHSAILHNRNLVIVGRSMEYAVNVSRELGIIKVPENRIIPVEFANRYKPEEICIICTGSQGEPMAALSRIANGDHKDLRIVPGDTVVFSSSAIPGNAQSIEKVVNQLVRRGCDVLTNSVLYAVHSSGHPSKQELRIMLKLIQPTYFMPIHGEYRMLKLHKDIAKQVGIPEENIFVLENGHSIELFNHKIKDGIRFSADPVYLDGRGIQGVSQSLMEDRSILKEEGLVSVVVGINSKKGQIIGEPIIVFKGVAFNGDKIKADTSKLVSLALTKLISNKTTFGEIKTTIKNVVSKFIENRYERSPMVIPVIMDGNY